MDASSLQQQQEIMASQSLNSMLVCTKSQNQVQIQQQAQDQKKPRPADEQALKCPRCDSTNTKFCYYNNYSLTQPRYFCKSCRRYWTKGGTLRNVPVGGGCRKNRRSSSSTSSRSRATLDHHHHHHHHQISTTPSTPSSISSFSSPFDHHHHHQNHHDPSTNDLTLAFASLHRQVGVGSMGIGGHEDHGSIPLLGNLNNPHFEHLYYGFGGGSGNLGDVENGRGNIVNHHQMGMQFDNLYHHNHNQEMMSNPSSGSSTPTTTIKQEMLGENNRVLLGLPWQLTSGEGNYMNGGGGAESWSAGVLGSSWHGLLNSPLM